LKQFVACGEDSCFADLGHSCSTMNRLSILVLGSGLHGLAGEERGFVVPQAGGSIAPAAVMQAADWKMTSVVDVDVEIKCHTFT
jgi:hypothetical protein